MITKISLTNFRRFDSFDLDIKNQYVILQGNNAVGKTSILEGVYTNCITKSLKTNNIDELVNFNKEYFSILLEKKYQKFILTYKEKKKKFSIDGKVINKTSEIIGLNPVVFFTPDEVDIINGTPAERRRFLNIEISQLNKEYLENLNLYNSILKERNTILKLKNFNKLYLDVLSEKLIFVAKAIMSIRQKFIDDLNQVINEQHKYFHNDESIKLVYNPSLATNNTLEFFNSKLENDIRKQTTTCGIHRDEFSILINNLEAKNFASQGQKRSIVLSIKISLCYLIKQYKNEFPILLLDDVFSELDINRQNKLLELVLTLGQTFISSTDTLSSDQKLLDKFQIITIKEE